MFLSIPLRKFNCKDNIKDEQKSSASILFNLKLWRILRKFFTKRPKYSRWKRRDTEIFPLRCRVYQTRLSLPFGVDDSVAAGYLCQQKKQWKWKAQNKFVQFVIKKQSLLPSFQGGVGGRLFPSQSTVNHQDWCFKCFRCFRCNYSAMQ